jgi:serine/threonine-protein kinase
VSSLEAPPPSSKATTSMGFGEIIAGKYRIEGMLGAGGMGLVLSARHLELDQPVAIKMLRDEALKDPDSRARFAREAKATVRLKSEHVARVFDVGTTDDGLPYLVMELLEGVDLATMLEERGPLSVDEAVAYILQACEAVAEAHAIGIVHRDLKPRNVFVTTSVDGKPLVKVLDFGISKIIHHTAGDTEDMALTKTKDVMGSPSYMAPEQLRAAKHADERSDIWSLGVIAFELVTGHMPWEAESTNELCAMVFRDPPKSLRALKPDAAALEPIVMRCLEKNGADRFESIEELARALEPLANGLAAGAADRIERVARTSKSPRTSDERSQRVSAGTAVSWGQNERPSAADPFAPSTTSRARAVPLAIAGVAVLLAVGAGGYAIARRQAPVAASPSAPVLPDDRNAIRPPASAEPSAVPDPPPTGVSTATLIASIPRTTKPAPSSRANAAAPSATPTASAASPDPHDIGSVGRK